jgi:adenylyl- and sulfurtransferase ThiI
MSFTLDIETEFSPQEVTEAIRSALEHEKHVAKYKVKSYSVTCKNFEENFGFSSSELRAKFENGNLGEENDFFAWYTAKRGLDHWGKRLEIISGISL